MVFLLLIANIFNLGADVTAMGAAAQLIFGGNLNALRLLIFGVASVALQIFVPYKKYVHYLKWLTLALFAYVATAFVVHVPWLAASSRDGFTEAVMDARLLDGAGRGAGHDH